MTAIRAELDGETDGPHFKTGRGAGALGASAAAGKKTEKKEKITKMRKILLAAGVLGVVVTTMTAAPERGAAQETGGLIAVGEMAPDFELAGATRHGVLRDRVRLSDYRGETVVLAFFFRVRTRG